MSNERQWLVPLTAGQIRLLRSAIDSHLYEQANNNDWPVNSGFVLDPRLDRLASDGPLTTMESEIVEALDEHDALDGLLQAFDIADTDLETT